MPLDFTAPGPDEHADPDLDTLGDGGPASDLDDLEAELTAAVVPSTVIKVDGRPGYAVRFRTDFTGQDLDNLRKSAKNKRMSDGIDGIRFASLLLGLTCQAVRRHGEDLELDGDSPVTFTSRSLQSLYGTNSADATIRAFYGLEGHVDSTARRLMAEAGWGDEADLGDPTE